LLVAVERANDRVVLANADAVGARGIGLRREHGAVPDRVLTGAERPRRLEKHASSGTAVQDNLEPLAEVHIISGRDDHLADGNVDFEGDVLRAVDLAEDVETRGQVER
jgi:hypothetical protein